MQAPSTSVWATNSTTIGGVSALRCVRLRLTPPLQATSVDSRSPFGIEQGNAAASALAVSLALFAADPSHAILHWGKSSRGRSGRGQIAAALSI
jgi:hypothetical protein